MTARQASFLMLRVSALWLIVHGAEGLAGISLMPNGIAVMAAGMFVWWRAAPLVRWLVPDDAPRRAEVRALLPSLVFIVGLAAMSAAVSSLVLICWRLVNYAISPNPWGPFGGAARGLLTVVDLLVKSAIAFALLRRTHAIARRLTWLLPSASRSAG